MFVCNIAGSGLVSPLGIASMQKTGPVEVDETDGDFNMVIGGKGKKKEGLMKGNIVYPNLRLLNGTNNF